MCTGRFYGGDPNSSTKIHKGPLLYPSDPQRSTNIHEYLHRSTTIHKDPQRSTNSSTEIQEFLSQINSIPLRSSNFFHRSTTFHKDPLFTNIHKESNDPQRSTNIHQATKPQRSTNMHKEAQIICVEFTRVR